MGEGIKHKLKMLNICSIYYTYNSRGISLLSVVGKLFGRVLIKRVRAGTKCAIGE